MNQLLIDSYLQRHEKTLENLIKTVPIPAQRIQSAIHYSLFPGGKRIRPMLVYLTGELINVPIQVLDVIAAAIELTHCYSLIHDDLPAMDNDDLRRGKPSCHKAYDEATAILAGDGLQALAIELLLTQLPQFLEASLIITVAKELVSACGVSGMVSGQSLDLSELAQAPVTVDHLKHIHHLKTGQLILACVKMVLAAQQTKEQILATALKTYAQHTGLVFQIQDDYLDHYAPRDCLGKGRSSDLVNEKTTFASLFSKEQLEQEISLHYQLAIEALSPMGDKACSLIEFTRNMQNRSNFLTHKT